MPNPGLVENSSAMSLKKTKELEISLHSMVMALIVPRLFGRLSCSSYWLKNQGNSSAFFLVNNQVQDDIFFYVVAILFVFIHERVGDGIVFGI